MQCLMKKGIYIGAGLAVMTAEKIKEAVNDLVKKGSISEQGGKKAIAELIAKSNQVKHDIERKVNQNVKVIVDRLNMPSRKEFDKLKASVNRMRMQQSRHPKA
ncbi:MAG: hypothetical protein KJ964_10030 [Verrucomicrobia bacterium]|nr:hypothetical protein [Verrucomicrobiota bacterium]MBU1735704.1 hypothetical protein [Verrucomicrobiota bacterium]MBU1858073.1 hypothetical protein [Verrucomicrobiota bacterium]